MRTKTPSGLLYILVVLAVITTFALPIMWLLYFFASPIVAVVFITVIVGISEVAEWRNVISEANQKNKR